MREEKRSEIIHDALNYLDDEMIEEVEKLRGDQEQVPAKETEFVKKQNRRMSPSWRRWASLAACICVLIIVAGVWHGIEGEGNLNSDIQESAPSDNKANAENDSFDKTDEDKEYMEDVLDTDSVVDESMNSGSDFSAVTLPAYSVNLGREEFAESDMALFFIYEGHCYVQTCDYMAKDVMGKYVCTTTGLVDEWTKKDGYVELAGSFEADIYTVKGVDPEFMLCTVYDDGVVETFVHNNGITISRGGEILEWLGFEVGMEDYAIFCSKGNSCDNAISEESRESLDKFFANFAENEVVLRKDISMATDEEDIYHLVIVTEDGVPLHFMLLNDGYVSYYGLQEVCVKIDKRIYEVVLDILEER